MRRLARVAGLILAAVIAAVVVLPLVLPIPPLEGTVQPEALADADSRFMDLSGLRVHYKTAGHGLPTLLLLHGFAANIFTWRDVLPRLSAGATVVAYDRPAFGLTSRPLAGEWQGESPYGTDFQARMAVDIMDRFGEEKGILIGHSAGGTVALLAAIRFPNKVSGLVLVDPAVYSGAGTPDWLAFLARTPQARRLGPVFVRSITSWGKDFGRSAWHDPSRFTEEIWAGYTVPLRARDWDKALWELTAANRPQGLTAQLGQVAVPTLIITGDDDRIVPTAQSIQLAGAIPGARLALLENCGHVPQEECSDAFMRAVTPFLETVRSAAR